MIDYMVDILPVLSVCASKFPDVAGAHVGPKIQGEGLMKLMVSSTINLGLLFTSSKILLI
jgi:hypothetical protein